MKGRLRPWYFLVGLFCVGYSFTLPNDEVVLAQSKKGDAVKEPPFETTPTLKLLDKESAAKIDQLYTQLNDDPRGVLYTAASPNDPVRRPR